MERHTASARRGDTVVSERTKELLDAGAFAARPRVLRYWPWDIGGHDYHLLHRRVGGRETAAVAIRKRLTKIIAANPFVAGRSELTTYVHHV